MTGTQADLARVEFFAPRERGLFTCANPRDHLAQLSSSALFAGLSALECGDICSRARMKRFFRREMLFEQGEPVRRLIWIQTGQVKLTHVNAGGHEVLLWVRGAGQPADLEGDGVESSHMCSAHAIERCQTLVWDSRSFRALAIRYPQLGVNIATILTARLRELAERFCEIASHDVADRLALGLVRLAESVGKPGRFGAELDLNRRELAQWTGSTLSTISRILSKWAEEGVVLTRRGGVVIPDPDRLRLGLRDFDRSSVHFSRPEPHARHYGRVLEARARPIG